MTYCALSCLKILYIIYRKLDVNHDIRSWNTGLQYFPMYKDSDKYLRYAHLLY